MGKPPWFFSSARHFSIFLLEFIRINAPLALDWTLAQWTYLLILALAVGFYFRRAKLEYS